MRKMKTAMDVRIRQQRGTTFQNPEMEIRQAGLMRIRGSFALREEVIAELPERYRKALMSMPYRQQEKILSEIEKKIDRKVQSGALAKTATRLDAGEQAEIRKMESSGQSNERKQAAISRYRLQGKTGTQKRIHSFDPSSLPTRLSEEGTWQVSGSEWNIDPNTKAAQMKRLHASRVKGIRAKQGKANLGRINGEQDDFQEAGLSNESETMLPEIKARSTGLENVDVATKRMRQGEAAARAVHRNSTRTRAGPEILSERRNISINSKTIQNEISINSDALGTNTFQASPETISYQQRLLAGARTKKEKAEIQKAIRAVSAGRSDKANSRALQKAALRTAYLERGTSGAYDQILKDAGFAGSGEKAAAQLAYEKQVMKTLKGEYRKQLTGKLSKLKTTSVMKKAQMQKFRQEQAQEDEMNRAMTEQTRESFGLMAKGTKVLKKLADDAAKAIRTLIRKKLAILIIPLLLAMMIPFLMMLIPILGTATATSYEDNEVYAYADATELIEYAKQWIGRIPYVWGGGHGGSPTAWQSGCDCSGFDTVYIDFGEIEPT